MQLPPYLKQGSVIGITCPSGYLDRDRINDAVNLLKQWDYDVKVGRSVGARHGYFAGTDEERREDLQEMLDDISLDAILMGRGGYGLSRIIDSLDFTSFKNKPKWICGFSDVTVLHNHIHRHFDIATLHSPMCIGISQDKSTADHIRNFHSALRGDALSYNIAASEYNRPGIIESVLTGGCLSLLAHLTGSLSEVDTTGKILFIEDTGEPMYNLDRMMLHLKRAGKLKGLAGLLVGSFDNTAGAEAFGQNIEQVVLDKVKEYDYPVCFNFQCGHDEVNYTLTLGIDHKLSVDKNGSRLELVR